MECPCCEEELRYHDYYGLGNPFRSDFQKQGDIYKCDNEDCDCFQDCFHTRNNDDSELHEGYPC